MAIDSWPLGLAQIPWPHPNSYVRPRCDPKAARLNMRNRLLNYFVRQEPQVLLERIAPAKFCIPHRIRIQILAPKRR